MNFLRLYLLSTVVSVAVLNTSPVLAQENMLEAELIEEENLDTLTDQESIEPGQLIKAETQQDEMEDSSQMLDLKVVLEDVYYTNPVLASERENLASVDENYAQATSNWRPSVAVDASYGYQNQSLEFNNNTAATQNIDQRNPITSAVVFTQPLYRGGRTIAQQRQALAEIKAARAQLIDQQQIIFAETVTAYMDVLQARAQLSLVENNETVQTKNLDATQDRFEVDDVTITDVSQAEARLARITADVIEAQGNLRNAKTRFQRIAGFRPIDLSIPSILLPIPNKRQEAEAIALKQNPNLLQQEEQYAAAQHNVRFEKGSLLPDLRFEARFSHNEDTGTFTAVDETATISARLSVPIYQQGLAFSRIRQANRVAARERFLVVDQRRLALTRVRQTWEDLITADARTEALAAEIEATSLALDGVRQESLVGTRTVLDVLDAEQEYLNARINKTLAERNQVVARFSVLRAIGRLTAPHLNLNVPYYQPAEHFSQIQAKWFGLNDNIASPGLTKTENIDKPIAKNVYQAAEGTLNTTKYGVEVSEQNKKEQDAMKTDFRTADSPAVVEAVSQQE